MRRITLAIAAVISFALLASACSGTNDKLQSQRKQAVKQRASEYAQAQSQVPTPNVSNFPRRKTLADAVIRQALPNHPWYVYVLGMNGNIVSYYVAKSVPVNDCDYLSSTQAVDSSDSGKVVLAAPSLEGIYQSSTGCNTLTFFDLASDAEIQITGMNTYVTDRPLRVSAQAIRVKP